MPIRNITEDAGRGNDRKGYLCLMQDTVYIETPRLFLRDWKAEDKAIFAEMNRNPKVMRYFPSLLTEEDSNGFVERITAEIRDCGHGLFAVELKDSGAFIGYVGFHRFCFEMPLVFNRPLIRLGRSQACLDSALGLNQTFSPGWEIGWRLSDRYWHRGFATEAAAACIAYAREKSIVRQLYSFTAVPNKPSEKVMQKIGMRYKQRFPHPALPEGHWLKEHLLYEILLQP